MQDGQILPHLAPVPQTRTFRLHPVHQTRYHRIHEYRGRSPPVTPPSKGFAPPDPSNLPLDRLRQRIRHRLAFRLGLVHRARQSSRAERHDRRGRIIPPRDPGTRCPRGTVDSRRLPGGCRARVGLHPRPGALLPNGPAAATGGRRTRRPAGRSGSGMGPSGPHPPISEPGGGCGGRRTARRPPPHRRLHRRCQRRFDLPERRAVRVLDPSRHTRTVAAGRHHAGAGGDVFCPARHRQPDGVRPRRDGGYGATGTACFPGAFRDNLGRAAAGRQHARPRSAFRRHPRPAPPATSSAAGESGGRTARCLLRQQQLGGCGTEDVSRRRTAGQRHAFGAAPPQHLVPGRHGVAGRRR